MAHNFHIILTSIASFLILLSFFMNIYFFYKKRNRNNKEFIKEEVPGMDNKMHEKGSPLILRFSFYDNSNCAAEVLINEEHLDVKKHHNFLLVLEKILEGEKSRHEFLKKNQRSKFKLIDFKKED